MRKLGLLMMLVFLSCNVWAQQDKTVQKDQVDPRIVEVYGNQLDNLVLKNPDRLKGLNDLLQNRISIIEEPIQKGEKYNKLSEYPLFNKYNENLKRDEVISDIKKFNVLKYDLKFFTDYSSAIRIDNTPYVIFITGQRKNYSK